MRFAAPELIVHLVVVGCDFDALLRDLEDRLDEGLDQLVDKIDETWREKATAQLNTTRDEYLQNLTIERVGRDLIQATLTGFLPVAIEEGTDSYDMKEGTLGNALSKVIPIGKKAGSPTFRTMKAGSDGWMHPGFKAKQISQQVQTEIDSRLVREVFEPLISRTSV